MLASGIKNQALPSDFGSFPSGKTSGGRLPQIVWIPAREFLFSWRVRNTTNSVEPPGTVGASE